jgi:hypothetical protein
MWTTTAESEISGREWGGWVGSRGLNEAVTETELSSLWRSKVEPRSAPKGSEGRDKAFEDLREDEFEELDAMTRLSRLRTGG